MVTKEKLVFYYKRDDFSFFTYLGFIDGTYYIWNFIFIFYIEQQSNHRLMAIMTENTWFHGIQKYEKTFDIFDQNSLL